MTMTNAHKAKAPNGMAVGTHPYADKFPLMDANETWELAASITANGLRSPVTVTPDGLVIDGRNRLRACEIAGVQPSFEVYEGDDVAEFVIDANAARRNMPPGARAMATALVLEADGRRVEAPGGGRRWEYGAVGNLADSPNSSRLKECGVVLDWAPELAAQVVDGSLALGAAFEQADAARKSAEHEKVAAKAKAKLEKEKAGAEAAAEAKIIADLTTAGAAKYLALVEDGTMAPRAAWAAWREDTRKEREAAEKDRKGRSGFYSGMAKALLGVASWDGYPDIAAMMAEYDPAELESPELEKYYGLDRLEAARRVMDGLIEWRKK